MAVCNYVRDATGNDPAAPWRGTYATEAGADAILAEFGGVLALFEHGMALAGFEPGEPVDGSAVVARIGGNEIAGVKMGKRIGFNSPDGLLETRAPILRAWNICHR